jgi:hypothetical protein
MYGIDVGMAIETGLGVFEAGINLGKLALGAEKVIPSLSRFGLWGEVRLG